MYITCTQKHAFTKHTYYERHTETIYVINIVTKFTKSGYTKRHSWAKSNDPRRSGRYVNEFRNEHALLKIIKTSFKISKHLLYWWDKN